MNGMVWSRHLVGTVAIGCALFAAAPALAAPTVRYVATTGDDTANDCSASGTPCKTIGQALSQATAGDEVIVGAGTYDLTNNLQTYVAVYLHGDPGGPRPVVRGNGGLLWITQPNTTVRHLAFVQTGTAFGIGATIWSDAGNVLLDDIDVSEDNNGTQVNQPAIVGYLQSPATGTLTLSNSSVSANTGASQPTVWAGAGQLVVRSTTISRRGGNGANVAALGAGQGGNNPAPTIDAKDVTIDTTDQSCITLFSDSGAGTLIRDVTATQDAPGAGNSFNSCLVIDHTSTFDNVTVNAPETSVAGNPVDGIGSSTPAVAVGLNYQPSSANVVLKNMTVTTRSVGVGVAPVTGLQIRGGRFTGRYAGIQLYGTTGVVSDAFTTGTDTNSYGITATNGSSIKLRNLTAIGTGTRQAIYATDAGTDITIKNTIARGTGTGEDLGVANTATMMVSHSNYVDTAVVSGGGSVTDLGGHQTGDPLFANPLLFDYHVPANSPVVDAGTTDPDLGATDIDGEPRIQDAAPDIGADERPAPAPAGGGGGDGGGGGGGGGGSPPPTDTTPTTTPTPIATQNVPGPVVTISAAAVKVTKTGVANIRIGCPATAAGSCTGTLALQTATPVSTAAKKKVVKLGSRSFKLGAGKQAFVGVKLNKQARKLLKKLKRLRVKAIANVQDANGAARITQRLLSLKLR